MRPTILVFIAHYLPGYKSGGPVRTIANMVDHLGDEFDFRIVTKDRDWGDSQSYVGVPTDCWTPVGRAQVFYIDNTNQTLAAFKGPIGGIEHDILYLNSFFSQGFTIQPLFFRRLGLLPRRPVIIAPRGEFSEGALALKRTKKTFYLHLARAIGLYDGLVWQASSEHEAADVRRTMGRTATSIMVAPDMPPVLPDNAIVESVSLRREPLEVVFLSRIARMKNLEFALRVLARVESPVRFNIFGPMADGTYWEKCQRLIDGLPSHVDAVYHGSVDHSKVRNVMARHHLFFLPTLGENYGHVIPEALSVGTPVLISDRTPWRDLEKQGVGWDLPLESHDVYRQRIEHVARMNDDEYRQLRQRARSWVRERLMDQRIIEANRQMFLSLLEQDGGRFARHG